MTMAVFASGRCQRARFCSSMLRQSLLLCLMVLTFLASPTNATKHSFQTSFDSRTLIAPVGVPFGFLEGGQFQLTVHDYEMTVEGIKGKKKVDPDDILSRVESGFFLRRYENEASFEQHMEILAEKKGQCAFDYFLDKDTGDDALNVDDDDFDDSALPMTAEHGILLSMKNRNKWTPNAPELSYTFKTGEAGLYFLVYQICPPNRYIRSSFELDFHFINFDAFGNDSYLTAGEMRLPLLFFFFAISYLTCLVIWATSICSIQKGGRGHFDNKGAVPRGTAKVYPIHHLMSALLLFKFLSLFFESIRYHAIRIYGHAEVWSFLYYAFTFVKGTFLFTVILLIGSGWSFVKPFLNDREKKIILVILVLQVVNNIALTILSNETEGEGGYQGWTATLHLVDIVCCCAVLLPIVWQVNSLEKSVGPEDEEVLDGRDGDLESGEKGEILSKLKLFRSFYLLVVAYIYSTRILVYLFATMLDYKHLWVRYFVVELVTLAFYVVVGLMFRPRVDNPYLSVKKGEDDESESLRREVELEEM